MSKFYTLTQRPTCENVTLIIRLSVDSARELRLGVRDDVCGNETPLNSYFPLLMQAEKSGL